MGKESAPPPPDYAAAAQQTAAGNLANARSTTQANRVDYTTPYGNLTYNQPDPNNPDKWSANVALAPQQQALLDQQSKTSAGLAGLQDSATARVGASLGQGMPDAYHPVDAGQATNNATDLINSRLLPQQERDSAALETQLANQGLAPGSAAYGTAKTLLGQTQNDARNGAALSGINLGMQQTQQGMAQQGQQYQQAFANRNAPINELSAIRSGSQVTNPTFQNAPQQNYTAGPDMLGATTSGYNAALQSASANNAASGSFMNGLFSLGGAALGAPVGTFSDRRLKKNIKRVGKLDNGLSVYSYEYKSGGPSQIGVMADEVLKVKPEAVGQRDGFLTVNYGAL